MQKKVRIYSANIHGAAIHRNNRVEMEYNTNIRKKEKLNIALYTEV